MTESFEPRFGSLVEIFERSVDRYAANPLFGTKRGSSWHWMSYREFGRDVDELRGGLATLGVGAGDAVAIIADNCPEWAVVAYATYGRSACFVPMYERQATREWEHILRDSDARVLFVPDRDTYEQVSELRPALPRLEHVIVIERGEGDVQHYGELRSRGRTEPVVADHPSGDEIAGVIYTSGTTGTPKGVILTHANLASNVSAVHEVFPMSPEDRSLSFLPWAHSFGQTVELHALFSMGASIGIAESISKLFANLEEVQPTLLFAVPRIFNQMRTRVLSQVELQGGVKRRLLYAALAVAKEKKELAARHERRGFVDLKHRLLDTYVSGRVRRRFGGRLKYAFSGGAPISPEVAEFIDALGILVYEGYGLTETSPITTANWPGARRVGTVGKPIPGVRVAIDREVTGDAKYGEVIVYGHNVMRGYRGLPARDEQTLMSDGGLRTGDLGFIDDDGFLSIAGRIEEQYQLESGRFVLPGPLENALQLSPLVEQAFVYGEARPYNVALIVPDFGRLQAWASAQGLDGDVSSLLGHEKVLALYREELDRHSGAFRQFEKVRTLRLLEDEFTIDDGLLTPKLSVKRHEVVGRYRGLIEELYP